MFLVRLAMRPAAAVFNWCQRWLPSNILVRRVLTRRGLRWGIPLALLGLVYFIAGVGCVGAVQLGGPGWWYIGVAVCWWTALKLVGHGLYATVMLPIVRAQESRAVRRAIQAEARVAALDEGAPRQVWTRARRRQLVGEVRAEVLAEDRAFV
ncbi:hypothetical protein [Microbacterium tumbae]